MNNNYIPINVFLELSKAFDTIDRNILQREINILWPKLLSLAFVQTLLQKGKQYTEIEQINSYILPITIGVP